VICFRYIHSLYYLGHKAKNNKKTTAASTQPYRLEAYNAGHTPIYTYSFSFIEVPVLVEVVATTTTIYFSWMQNGTLDRYTVSYTYTIRGNGCDSVLTGNSTELGNETRNYMLMDLEENSDYAITLNAIKGRRHGGTHIPATTNVTGAF
jgi:hypothetical protein